MKIDKFILGLDIGTNSIGSAIVNTDESMTPLGLGGLHHRIFQEMVTADKRVPKNKTRREKRGARKLISRYKERRTELVTLLVKNGMLPESIPSTSNWEGILNDIGSPLLLRAKGMKEPLSFHQFGRVMLHFLRRRGYRSNRGAKYIELMEHPAVIKLKKDELQDDERAEGEEKAQADERKKVLGGIEKVHNALRPNETLGQFIIRTCRENNLSPRRLTKLKIGENSLYADRNLYKKEFEGLWSAQKEHLKLSEGLKAAIYHAIFFQRPLKIQKNLVGKCSFENGKSRAAKALLEAQEFRIYQELNDLTIEINGEIRRLTTEQRKMLFAALHNPDKLNNKGFLNWTEVKKELELGRNARFNLQRTSKDGLSANRTHIALNAVISQWSSFDKNTQKALITDLLTIHNKRHLFNRLMNESKRKNNPWNFTAEEAYALATLELESGYMKHCLKAINKLIGNSKKPGPMREGKSYHDACQEAGYLRKDQVPPMCNEYLDAPPYVANPIVQKALHETRRVVNATLKEYGRPTVIRIELARDLRSSKKHRKQIQSQQEKNRKHNIKVAEELEQYAKRPEYRIELRNGHLKKTDIERYKLWEELGEPHLCPYCENPMNPIGISLLFTGDIEIDHIFPLSRSHDDSYLNKILCCRKCNQEKGQHTPYEKWHGTQRFENILSRLEKMTKRKESIFDLRKLDRIKESAFDGEGFVSAQLNDTRYISVAVKNYLEQLGIPIQITTGKATAPIRRFLGLNNILPKKQVSTANDLGGNIEEESGFDDNADNEDEDENDKDKSKQDADKKIRDDHRHHAIDAFVVALTDKKLFDALTKRYQHYEKKGTWPEELLEKALNWDTLRNDVKNAAMNSVVSFASNRKIFGPLHKEMPFGASHYITSEKVKTLKQEIIDNHPEDPETEDWIYNAKDKELIRAWFKANENLPRAKKQPYPVRADGKPLEKVRVAHRCYVKRIPVKNALKCVNNHPGKKTWIVDEGMKKLLSDWLAKPGKTMEKLASNPPTLSNHSNPEKKIPVNAVRVATRFSPTSIRRIGKHQQIHELGSNHHVLIFKNRETGDRKGKIVPMLDAAARVVNPPIVRPYHQDFDPAVWEFEFFLCNNDMVLWDTSDTTWLEEKTSHHSLGAPIYRVQKFSQSDSGISIVFRHHTVTATRNTDNWGVIRCTPNTIRCKKLMIDALGKWTLEKKEELPQQDNHSDKF